MGVLCNADARQLTRISFRSSGLQRLSRIGDKNGDGFRHNALKMRITALSAQPILRPACRLVR